MGKTAIVTGGSRGIGRAIVDRLRADGYNVVTCGRVARPDELPEAVLWVTADVSKTGDAATLIKAANKAFGSVDLLVNNAGVQVEKTVADSDDDDWDLVMNVNCKGVFNMCRVALLDMVELGV